MTRDETLTILAQFSTEIANMSLDELKKKEGEIQEGISRMMLDSDLVLKAAIIKGRIEELEKSDGGTK